MTTFLKLLTNLRVFPLLSNFSQISLFKNRRHFLLVFPNVDKFNPTLFRCLYFFIETLTNFCKNLFLVKLCENISANVILGTSLFASRITRWALARMSYAFLQKASVFLKITNFYEKSWALKLMIKEPWLTRNSRFFN